MTLEMPRELAWTYKPAAIEEQDFSKDLKMYSPKSLKHILAALHFILFGYWDKLSELYLSVWLLTASIENLHCKQ